MACMTLSNPSQLIESLVDRLELLVDVDWRMVAHFGDAQERAGRPRRSGGERPAVMMDRPVVRWIGRQ